MKSRFVDLICFAVLCIVLSLGLWPFHAPKNEVSWLENHNGLRFGRYGTVISGRALAKPTPESDSSSSIEIWLQPSRIWDSNTFLAFYKPDAPRQFSLRQSQTDLELHIEARSDSPSTRTSRLYVPNTFRRSAPAFLTITSGIHGTSVYTDGRPTRTAPQFQLSATDFTGQLILGDSPGQSDSWSGEMFGLAIYSRELTAIQVLLHYQSWTQSGRPKFSPDDRNLALYLFDEHSGNVVHDRADSGVDAHIPEKYIVVDQILLDPFWREFSLSRSYWSGVLKNIIGFVPFGFCFYACLSIHKVKRSALATVVLGTLVSLTIEVLQTYLPTRDSGTTDLFTNTLGTYLGVLAWRATGTIIASTFGRWFLVY